MLTMDVISNDLPLLLSKEAVKKDSTQTDFASDKINIFGHDVLVIFCTSGHSCMPIGRAYPKNVLIFWGILNMATVKSV